MQFQSSLEYVARPKRPPVPFKDIRTLEIIAALDNMIVEAINRPALDYLDKGSTKKGHVSTTEMRGKASHRRRGAKARQIAYFIMYGLGYSMPQIADAYDRDHTTCLYGRDKIATELKRYPQTELAHTVRRIANTMAHRFEHPFDVDVLAAYYG